MHGCTGDSRVPARKRCGGAQHVGILVGSNLGDLGIIQRVPRGSWRQAHLQPHRQQIGRRACTARGGRRRWRWRGQCSVVTCEGLDVRAGPCAGRLQRRNRGCAQDWRRVAIAA